MYIKRYNDFRILKERLSLDELHQVYKVVIENIPYDFERVITMDVLNNHSKMMIPEEKEMKLFASDAVLKNYKLYFKDYQEFETGDIIKFEFQGYEWFMIFMGVTKNNEKLAHMAFSPDMDNFRLITRIGNILKKFGFKIFPQKNKKELHNSIEFIEDLITIFRKSSGRYYSPFMFKDIKNQYDILKDNKPKDYLMFKNRKKEILGKSVECIRRLGGISSTYKWVKLNGEEVYTKDLKVGDKVYYSTYGREFSQWAENNSNLNLNGILSNDSFEIKADIPTNKIVYSNSILPAGFSPHVLEGEVIVEHNSNIDKDIICEIVKNKI
jgi:hypothetical protein